MYVRLRAVPKDDPIENASVSSVAFKVYDMDRDGYISNGELFLVLKMMVGNNLKVGSATLCALLLVEPIRTIRRPAGHPTPRNCGQDDHGGG